MVKKQVGLVVRCSTKPERDLIEMGAWHGRVKEQKERRNGIGYRIPD